MFGRSKKEKSVQSAQDTSASQNTSARSCGGRCTKSSSAQSAKSCSDSTRSTTRSCK